MGEARGRQRLEMAGARRIEGEGQPGAAQVGRNGRIERAEVADVKLVQGDLFRGGQRRFDQGVPAFRLQGRVGEVDDLAPGAVHRQAPAVRIGHPVRLDQAGGRNVDLDLVQVVHPLPGGLARRAPDAVPFGHRHGAGRRRRRRVGEEEQAHAPRGGRPDMESRHAGRPGHAEFAVMVEEVIEHAGDLQAGGVLDPAVGAGHRHGQLPLEQLGSAGGIGRRETERRHPLQVGEVGQHVGRQAGGVPGQRKRLAAGQAVDRRLESPLRGEMESEGGVLGRPAGPGDQVAAHPVGPPLRQVAGGQPGHVGRGRIDRVPARDDPGFAPLVGNDQEHVRPGILHVTLVNEETDLAGARLQVDVPVEAEIVLAGRRQRRGPGDRIGRVFPGVQAEALVPAVGPVIVDAGLPLFQRRSGRQRRFRRRGGGAPLHRAHRVLPAVAVVHERLGVGVDRAVGEPGLHVRRPLAVDEVLVLILARLEIHRQRPASVRLLRQRGLAPVVHRAAQRHRRGRRSGGGNVAEGDLLRPDRRHGGQEEGGDESEEEETAGTHHRLLCGRLPGERDSLGRPVW